MPSGSQSVNGFKPAPATKISQELLQGDLQTPTAGNLSPHDFLSKDGTNALLFPINASKYKVIVIVCQLSDFRQVILKGC